MPVHLIDPIDSVSKLPKNLNGTPEYEKMFIFVELTAERRGRSVIVSSENGTNIDNSQPFEDLRVNLMGADISGNIARLTTKWTDNTSQSEKILEGFGITQIDIKVTSSFIPEVTIEFVDIKGMAFFNKGKNSPYSILFDFPPALYNLTVKGYYGKALTYQLHLVTHSTRFESATGNYYTTANFIARTFAPLTDIPFKMVEMLPLIDQKTEDTIDLNSQIPGLDVNAEDMNVNAKVRPRNTYEMIKKLESLYDYVNDVRDNSEESQDIADIQKKLKLANTLYNHLNSFNLQSKTLQNSRNKIIRDLNTDFGNDKDLGRIIRNINEFNSVIAAGGTTGVALNNLSDLRTRLLLGVKLFPNTGNDTTLSAEEQSKRKTLINENLNAFKLIVLENAKTFLSVNESDIEGPIEEIDMPELNQSSNSTTEYTRYVCLDITKLYWKLYKYINDQAQDLKKKNTNLREKVSNVARTRLGMDLTPYDVFKIICDDIDKFFNKLRKTNYDAENHHNEFADLISSNPEIKDGKQKKLTKLYSFPLYVKQNVTCGVIREARAYPEDLSSTLPRPFPEVELVEDFIDAFINLRKEKRVEDLRTQEDAEGNHKWIPVTPIDSKLITSDYSSPYANVELRGKEDQITNSILNIILNRFYIASQFTYGNSFYNSSKRKDLIKFLAGAEAVNLSNSLVNNETIGFFESKAKQYKTSADQFYSDLTQLGIDNYMVISPSMALSLNLDQDPRFVYRNRTNPDYNGVYILNNSELKPTREVNDISGSDPIDTYLKTNSNWWSNIVDSIFSKNEAKITRFTTENIPHLSDVDFDESKPASRYVNFEIRTQASAFNPSVTYKTNSIDRIWAEILSIADDNVLAFLNGPASDASKAFWLVSNFGYSISYFDQSVNKFFKNPALVEAANFSALYMGGLHYYNSNIENVKTDIDDLYNNEFARSYPFNKARILADNESITKLSANDLAIFSDRFSRFIGNDNLDGFRTLLNLTVTMIERVKTMIENGQLTNSILDKNDQYYEFLRSGEYKQIMSTLNLRVGILNFSEYTFSNEADTESNFIPLATTNQNGTNIKTANDLYFEEFFRVLNETLPEKKEDLMKEDVESSKSLNDPDIKTQLYYTFKSISDKWISGLGSDVNKGFPLNRGANDPLINKFIFVDRAMNPIGDQVILNVQSLIELSKDYDVNVFTVFSRILSENGFEIFPLQNFMVHSTGSWEDLFKIYETVNQPSTPLFVCMYIGGTSSVLNSVSSEYEDDGIMDLIGEALPDFHLENECDGPEVQDKETARVNSEAERFKYSQVRAFRVRYGEQNQSFFTDIQLDSKEFPETAESLAILSQIAGDESTSTPIPKGQNLFSVYENRAYTTTVTMLGNVMIQPTQYFQLENIPMYGGAYVILDVNHRITPNHMITQFQGTRILKYPNPFVTDFAASVGINGTTVEVDEGNEEITSNSNKYLGVVTNENGDVLLPQLQHNSMYSLRIS